MDLGVVPEQPLEKAVAEEQSNKCGGHDSRRNTDFIHQTHGIKKPPNQLAS